LWTLLLSAGYALGVPYKLWTYGLGITLLGLTGYTVFRLGRRFFPDLPRVGPLAGLFCLLEWHLAWAAVSGMETMLFVWLSVWLVERYFARQRAVWLGLIAGLLTLTRPEGLGLLGLVALDMAYRRRQAGLRPLLVGWAGLAAGAAVLVGPYVAWHLWLTGQPFPNTLYAKQAEYAEILTNFPWWWKFFGNMGQPVDTVQGVFRVVFVGAQLLLIPGLGVAAMLTRRLNRTDLALLWLWWPAFLALYGLRLPVTYQHGRYQIPAIPWLVLLGVWGMVWLVQQPCGRQQFFRRTVRRVLALSLIILTPAFAAVGAQAYGRDVRIIETEMVAAARWLHLHTPPTAVIAVHDIGAIGYFTRRPLLDLAGLITPEVIPIIRDEAALLDFVVARQADYLVTFPSWYPELTRSPRLQLVFMTRAPWAPQAGGDNMAVYAVSRPQPPGIAQNP
jgi:hypothetical protein